jgi:NAD(P)-dependent dehydrogenase (short-subunit alcohol dehydrogenase family)
MTSRSPTAKVVRVAVVTGAGSGIGKASALGLLREGYAVSLAGRRAENLERVLEEAAEHRTRALAIPTDVRDPEAVRALFARTVSSFGRVDLLFNNAGINAPGIPLEDLDYESWRAVLDTSVTGAFLCTREAFKIMKRQDPRGGRIINNGSISAHAPRPDSAAYTAAKHAVTGLTRSTSLDGRKHDIACGQIDIGNARTELAERMSSGVKQAGGEVAAEPMMDVDHAAKAVLFMASLPLEANVQFLTVMATKMPFIGRG